MRITDWVHEPTCIPNDGSCSRSRGGMAPSNKVPAASARNHHRRVANLIGREVRLIW